MKRFTLLLASIVFVVATAAFAAEPDADGFVSIFDGKTLEGWKANEPETNFKVENGEIVGFGGRCHLYFMKELKNFELKIDVLINDGGNSGVCIKCPWIEKNWPTGPQDGGFELQVNATQSDPVKTGSLYNIIKFFKAPHEADNWFTYHIICKGNELTVKIDDKVLYTYVDPAGKEPTTDAKGKKLKHVSQAGYISLQQHDPGSLPRFKNIKIKEF